jgi:hypothetical protein
MTDKVCKAALETLAGELNISRMTVIRALRELVADGYLRDLSPDTRNRPHVLKVTDKLAVMARWESVSDGVSKVDTTEKAGVSNLDTTVTILDGGSNNMLQRGVPKCDLNQTFLIDRETSQEKATLPKRELPDPKKTWQQIRADLQHLIGNPVIYQQKVAPCSLIGWENLELCIQAPDSATRDWMIGRAAREVNRRLETILPGATVRFTARPIDGQRQAA